MKEGSWSGLRDSDDDERGDGEGYRTLLVMRGTKERDTRLC